MVGNGYLTSKEGQDSLVVTSYTPASYGNNSTQGNIVLVNLTNNTYADLSLAIKIDGSEIINPTMRLWADDYQIKAPNSYLQSLDMYQLMLNSTTPISTICIGANQTLTMSLSYPCVDTFQFSSHDLTVYLSQDQFGDRLDGQVIIIPQTEAYLEVLSIGPLHHDDIYQLFFDPIKNETVYINKHPNFLQRYLNYSIDRINVANYRAVSNINALGETYFNVTVHNNNTFPVNSVTLFGQIPSRGSNILDWHALFDDVLQPNETYVFPVGIKELPTNTFATGYLTQISNSSNKP
ncbi:hypothetical protein GX563_12090 [Candidatus Bathyarchaeota archaeon]|jgi:hypothetical protein|nr:hypothetical protein [Candidatus Bathyarchaeota archaeon]